MKVYDYEGNEKTLDWLKEHYGNFVIQDAAEGEGPVWHISALREKYGDTALIVRCTDEDGARLPSVEAAFYWPDADYDPNAGPLGGVIPGMVPDRCVHGPTNVEGEVGFGMGPGAYYYLDRGEIGPHAAWIYGADTRSDVILGLGMLAGTNHYHFDVEFTRYETEPEPPPPPPDENWDVLFAYLAALLEVSDAQLTVAERIAAQLESGYAVIPLKWVKKEV